MRFLFLCLVIVLIQCSLSFTFGVKENYVEVHEIDKEKLSSMERLPPQDPAMHSFPTVPVVPLVPTCTRQGYFRDPFNCRKFYHCQHENDVPKGFYCQSGLIFNTITNSCDHPGSVEC